jgi:hypothetical protein
MPTSDNNVVWTVVLGFMTEVYQFLAMPDNDTKRPQTSFQMSPVGDSPYRPSNRCRRPIIGLTEEA